MRTFILFLLVSLACLCTVKVAHWQKVAQDEPRVGSETAPDELKILKHHRGKDLRKLEDGQMKELLDAITKLVPNRNYNGYFDLEPWHVWGFREKEDQPFYILFEARGGPHPGSTGIRITLINHAGRVTSETTFTTGHRCYLRGVKLETTLVDGEYPIIILETGPGGGPGPNTYRQYYGKIRDDFNLIRLENFDGNATRNGYYVRHFQSGPAIPKQTEEEWTADVLSKDRLRLLRALVWLGGTHYDLKPGDKPGNQDEEPEHAALARRVRENKEVMARLKKLVESEDRWVREAARLASKPEEHRF